MLKLQTTSKMENNMDESQSSKVLVFFRTVGAAPGLKKTKFKIDSSKSVAEIDLFLRKILKYEGSLFLYCGYGFCPTPDQSLRDLYDCFHSGSELVIFYGYQEAWG